MPIYNLMEDAAAAEISRTQVWQWIHHGAHLTDGRCIDAELVRPIIPQQLERIRRLIGPARFDSSKFDIASGLFGRIMTSENFPDFLTLAAYEYLD